MFTIKINKSVKSNFRPNSARALYYEALVKYDGKSVESFSKAMAKAPPSVPKRGKLQGKPEPIQGWISYFVRGGFVALK